MNISKKFHNNVSNMSAHLRVIIMFPDQSSRTRVVKYSTSVLTLVQRKRPQHTHRHSIGAQPSISFS